jgi:hypothetical protein
VWGPSATPSRYHIPRFPKLVPSRTRDGFHCLARNRPAHLFVDDDWADGATDLALNAREESVMRKQKTAKTKILIVALLLYPACALAQISGGSSGAGAHGSSMGGTTTGIASDQAHISPPGTNSLGTANSSGMPGGATVGANMEPKDSRHIDAEIRDENSKIDSEINNICKGC